MDSGGRGARAVLEESPEYFWERFAQYAQTWPVSPEPLGSPLLEVLTPLGPLFAFDRTLAPLLGGQAPMIFHGQVERLEPGQEGGVQHRGGGRYLATGRVEAVLGGSFFVLGVEAAGGEGRLLLVLAGPAQGRPEQGAWVTAQIAPPLMVFRADTAHR